jgi:TolA-binding protein
VVASKWPANPKAPDALLNMATCQQELADAKGAKSTLEALVAKYPDSTRRRHRPAAPEEVDGEGIGRDRFR